MDSKSLKDKKYCNTCERDKNVTDFYVSGSKFDADGRFGVCKPCLKKNIDYSNMQTVKDALLQMNRPFIASIWESAIEEATLKRQDTFGLYIKTIQLKKFKDLTWNDSVLTEDTQEQGTNNQINISSEYDIGELKDKYGYGYPDDEYILFENKYQQLKSSFQLLTTMHEEYFREFCVNKVKETLAKSSGDLKGAKEWAAMVKDVAEAGKLKPSQMSKADLSGGLDGFGQLARIVEENHEIMGLLPSFIEQPKDKVDVTLWCYINYVRDIKGLPSCEYKEIYEFYDKRKMDYESQMSDLNKEDSDHG
ncbi:hypothetical protein [Paenibacillus taichungensis]|uniref:hypothetical protein n=1 Tax=Paenibacillus taichungensis TaxID=484184 RepID=UPI0039A35C6F